jgi:tetratricopeptide (TPR) repeat protein/transcriptional regulator with XRE-family HTH domain
MPSNGDRKFDRQLTGSSQSRKVNARSARWSANATMAADRSVGRSVFGELVQAHRQRLRMTQEDLAQRTGLSVRTIREIEAGRVRVPRRTSVRLFADAFGLEGPDRDRFEAAGQAEPAPDEERLTPVPAQLPADVPGFTGRQRELADLDALLAAPTPDESAPGPGAGPVVISAVSGTAGVGKTALAIRWAHRTRDRFPDGQLYINLRGYDPEQPMTAADALARLLAALGVSDVPADEDDRAARYRSETANLRILILLDNAASGEQVRPLLPGASSCAVVVTSRDRLSGLVAVDGARRLDLDLLSTAEAVALLRTLIGPRVDAEPAAAAALAELCGRLPLALRVAAELAASRSGTPLGDLVVELSDDQRRLDLLRAGDDRRAAVTSVFSWSVRHLPPGVAQVFRLLSLHPGPDFDPYAVAALAGSDLERARRAVEVLVQAHLVHRAGPQRYGLHDLLRAYAARLAAERPAEERDAARDRLFDHELATAAAAMDVLFPSEAYRRPRVAPVPTPAPAFGRPEDARDWLDAELPTLVAVATAAAPDRPRHTIRLAACLFRYLDGGRHPEALTIQGLARDAARSVGDVSAEAHALTSLGSIHLRLGRVDEATDLLLRAFALFQQTTNEFGHARSLTYLARLEHHLGRYASSFDHHTAALAWFQRAGDEQSEAACLTSLAIVATDMGRYEVAVDHFEGALTIARRTGNLESEAYALNQLGGVERLLGRYEIAARHHERALALFRQGGRRTGQAWALVGLGDTYTGLGRPDQARAHHQRALEMFRDLGERSFEAWALNGLGEAERVAGNLGPADAHHRAALAIAAATAARDQQARAHHGLGQVYEALGEFGPAGDHYRQALAVYVDLGSPEAEQVRTRLAAVHDGQFSPRG